MKWLKGLGTLLFILSFMAGVLGCSTSKAQMKNEAGKETLAKRESIAPSSIPPPSPAKEKDLAGEKKTLVKEGDSVPPAKPPEEKLLPPPLPLPGSPLGVKTPAPAPGSKFVLNFDNADLYEVIRVMADMMKINYIVDPKVKGIVNIHTSGQLSTAEIFPLFQSILKLNGATAVQKGILYEIVPLGDAKKLFSAPTIPGESGKAPGEERYTIQIIRLKYIPVTEVSKFIKPFLSDGADIIEHPPHNILIIGDLASNVKKSLSIIELFDLDIFATLRVRIYPILNADVNEIAKEMERIFSSLEVNVKSGRGVGITFTPVQRINSLLVVSSIPEIFPNVERWLKELDRIPTEGTKLSVFVYYVQNGKAKDLAEVLKQVYISAKEKKLEFKEKITPASPAARGVRPSPSGAAPGSPAAEGTTASSEGGVPEGEVNIVVDETTNSLIIRAYPRDYKAILETIKKLDLYPKQVLIEVLLAEVTLDEETKYGLEFSTFSDTFNQGSYAYTIGMGGIGTPASFVSGLRYSVTRADKLAAAIHASATDNRLKVITSPHILASNNKEAKIQIGSSEPILTNTYTTPGAAAATTTSVVSTGIVEGTIEYKDIGVILSVTPRISEAKVVTLDIAIEQSSVAQKDLGNLKNVPFFPKKTAKTTLSVTEGQTIVIGGLIDDSKSDGSSGVPFLSKIPILGALFGYQTKSVNATETILMMTPHVITDLHESNQVTQEFREKVRGIKKALEMKEQEGKKK